MIGATGSIAARRRVTAGITGILDSYPQADVMHGLARLYGTTYYASGKIFTGRRSSDNAEKDFYMDGTSAFNDAENGSGTDLLTWAGSNDVFIKRLHNQGSLGADKNLIQTTTSAQLKIVSAGSLITDNGLPATDNPGTAWYTFETGTMYSGGASDQSTVYIGNRASMSDALCAYGGTTSASSYPLFIQSGGTVYTSSSGHYKGYSYGGTGQHIYHSVNREITDSNIQSFKSYYDATELTGSGGNYTYATTWDGFMRWNTSSYYKGKWQMAGNWASDQTSNWTSIIAALKTYWGTP